MVITSHFTPVVIRKNWCFLILCDYKTARPSLPYPQVHDHVHSPPIPPHPQVHHVPHTHRVRKSIVSPTSTTSASPPCLPQPLRPTCRPRPPCQPCRHRCLWDTTHEWLGRLLSKGRSGGQWRAGASLTITCIATFRHGEFRLVCQTLTFKRWHWLGRN